MKVTSKPKNTILEERINNCETVEDLFSIRAELSYAPYWVIYKAQEKKIELSYGDICKLQKIGKYKDGWVRRFCESNFIYR